MPTRRRDSLLTYLVVGPFAIVLAFPFYWMLQTSLKSERDLYNVENVPFSFGDGSPTLDNYRFLFSDTQYARWLLNTVLVGIVVVVITLVVALPAGYALARLSGRWGQSLGVGIFLVYLVPPTLLFLPLSRVIAEVGLQDRLASLILVYPGFTIPFATWLLMGFFKSIPPELEDAALVDGASRVRTLFRIVFPISLPGILTVVIFTFSLCVNEFIYALAFITHSRLESGLDGYLHRADSRRRLLLGCADGRNADSLDPTRPALQHVPRPLHRRVHRRRFPLTDSLSAHGPHRGKEIQMADDSRTTDRPEEEVAGGRVTRREILKKAGAGSLLVVYGGAVPKTAAAGVPKYRHKELAGTLRIIQWSHFVPAYDKWFDNIYIKRWGEANDTEVLVDHINQADIPARAAAEVAAQSGHDLFFFLSPPAAYEDQVINHAHDRPGGDEEARQDERRRAEVDVQPEDEEVLRLLRQLRPRPGQLPDGSLGRGRAQADHLGQRAQGGAEAAGR